MTVLKMFVLYFGLYSTKRGCLTWKLITEINHNNKKIYHLSFLACPSSTYSLLRLITLRHTTLGTIPLDKWSARRRDPYLITHNTHQRHISMPTEGFEPAIPASERPQTHALDGAATGTSSKQLATHQSEW